MRILTFLCLAAALLTPDTAPAQSPAFGSPVECAMRQTCWVVQYFDHDPSPEAADFTGGPRSYDGHDGTDIGITNYAEMARGVPVIAAADGVVTAIRDGVVDFGPDNFDRAAVEGRECGNAVRIEHGDGWRSVYCHMRRGSVQVAEGQQVAEGEPLGLVGQSGAAEFPHLHFSLLHENREIDPFAPDEGGPLWSDGAAQAMAYSPVDIYHLGFADEAPDIPRMRLGAYNRLDFPPSAEALVFWVEVFGLRAGDEVGITVTGPDGTLVAENQEVMERNRVRIFRYVGSRRPGPAWPAGAYQAEISIRRSTPDGPLVQTRFETALIQ